MEAFKKLDEKFEAEKQIKFLIELERADIQIKAYELYSSTHAQQKSDLVLEEYKKYKDTILSKIDVAVLENYKRIKEGKGEALAKIDNYKCSACNVAIPKMTVWRIWEVLCFQAYRTAAWERSAMLSADAGLEVAGIELHSRLCGIHLHCSAAAGRTEQRL